MLANVLHAINGVDKQPIPYRPHPSLVGGQDRCLRASVYWRVGAPRNLADRALTLAVEHEVMKELTMQVIREKSAYTLSDEKMRVICGTDEYPLEASIDGILTDMLGNRYLLQIELVTQLTFEFLLQGHSCVEGLIKCCFLMKGSGLTQCDLLFKNKNTSAYLDYLLRYDCATDYLEILTTSSSHGDPVVPSQNLYHGLYASGSRWFRTVEEYAGSSELPPRPFHHTSWQCSYCSYPRLCWEHLSDNLQNPQPEKWSSRVHRASKELHQHVEL